MLYIPAMWYFDISVICPHIFRRVKFVIIPPCFVKQQYLWNMALQPSVGCYNLCANLCCLGCSPLGEKSLWNGTITIPYYSVIPVLGGWTPILPMYEKLHFMYKLVCTSSKCCCSIYYTSSKCCWSIYCTSGKSGALRVGHEVEQISSTVLSLQLSWTSIHCDQVTHISMA